MSRGKVETLGVGQVVDDGRVAGSLAQHASRLGEQASLEDAYLRLTDDAVTYRTGETR